MNRPSGSDSVKHIDNLKSQIDRLEFISYDWEGLHLKCQENNEFAPLRNKAYSCMKRTPHLYFMYFCKPFDPTVVQMLKDLLCHVPIRFF